MDTTGIKHSKNYVQHWDGPSGTLYSGDLKSKCVQISNGQRGLSLKMARISNEIWNQEAWLFEIWINFKIHLKSGQKQPILNGPVFKCPGPLPFRNRTIWNPIFKNQDLESFWILSGWIPDPYRTRNTAWTFFSKILCFRASQPSVKNWEERCAKV